jgi:hypothetical protein
LSASVDDIEKAVVTFAEIWRGRRVDELASPNLIGIGSGRCGTSYLYGLLQASADVYVTPVKEANYFGIASRQGMTLREYKCLFAGQQTQRWVSEITPVYMYAPNGLEEMREVLGRVKLVATLRNPLTRLVSHFKYHHAYHGYSDFEAYLKDGLAEIRAGKPLRWSAPSQGIRMSLYAPALQRAKNLFDGENLLVLIYEDLMADPRIWNRQIGDYIGVPQPDEAVHARFRNASPKEEVAPADPGLLSEVIDLFAADIADLHPFVEPRVLDDWSRDIRAVAEAA